MSLLSSSVNRGNEANILDAAGGVVGAPNAALQIASTIGVLGFALIIVLVVLPRSRRALTTAYQPSRVK